MKTPTMSMRPFRFCLGCLLATALAAAGCNASSDAGPRLQDTGWQIDAGDTGQRPDTSDPRQPHEVTFKLKNRTAVPLTIQPLAPDTQTPRDWVQLHRAIQDQGDVDGESRLDARKSCRQCECKDAQSGDCRPCARPEPSIGRETISPNGQQTWRWSGRVFQIKTVDSRACVDPRIPADGTQLYVRFCWSPRTDDKPDPVCKIHAFRYGEVSSVTHVVGKKHEGEANPRTLRLVNDTDDHLTVWKASPCRQDAKDWAQIYRYEFGKRRRMKARSHCSECHCPGGRGQTCSGCPQPCPSQRAKSLPAGEKLEWRWDGRLHAYEGGGTKTCLKSFTPNARMAAKFCWAEGPPPPTAHGGHGGSKAVECAWVDFLPDGEGPIVHRVEGDDQNHQKVAFKLHNRTGSSVVLRGISACRQTQSDWLKLHDVSTSRSAERLKLKSDCTTCTCDQIGPNQGCAVCAKACVGPNRKKLPAGKTRSFEWNGRALRPDSKHGRSCLKKTDITPGTRLRATFCWADAAPRPPGHSSSVDCESVVFEYGEQRVVEHTLKGKKQKPVETTFRLTNGSGKPVRVEANQCRYSHPGWFELKHGKRTVRPDPGQCDCTCETLKRGGRCGPCAVRCAPPKLEKLPDGKAREWTWDGTYHASSKHSGRQCLEEKVPQVGDQLTAKFCWGDGPTPLGRGPLRNPTCRTATFRYGTDRVTLQIP